MIYPSKIRYCKSMACKVYPCCHPDYYTLDETIYRVKLYFSELMEDIYHNKINGIGNISLTIYNKLKHYLKALEHEQYLILRNVKSCLCNEALCRLIEKTRALIPIRCFLGKRMDDIKKINTDITATCKSFDSWNRLTKNLCHAMNMNIEVSDPKVGQACNNFAMTLAMDNSLLDMAKQMSKMPYCNINLNMDIKELKCKPEYKLKISTKCHIEYELVDKLISCGITPQFIIESSNCDFNFVVVGKDKCDQAIELITSTNNCESDLSVASEDACVLIYKLDKIINLCDIKFNNEVNLDKCLKQLS